MILCSSWRKYSIFRCCIPSCSENIREHIRYGTCWTYESSRARKRQRWSWRGRWKKWNWTKEKRYFIEEGMKLSVLYWNQSIGGPVGSKTYILRSLLPEDLIHIASIPREDLIDLEYDNDADDDAPQPPGTIIDWNSADQLSGSGILMIILSLILVSGHTMSDRKCSSFCWWSGLCWHPLTSRVEDSS